MMTKLEPDRITAVEMWWRGERWRFERMDDLKEPTPPPMKPTAKLADCVENGLVFD